MMLHSFLRDIPLRGLTVMELVLEDGGLFSDEWTLNGWRVTLMSDQNCEEFHENFENSWVRFMSPRHCSDELAILAGFVRRTPWPVSFMRQMGFFLGLHERDGR